MRRYPIEVVKKKIRRRDPEEAAEISRRSYLEILALTRRTYLWEEVESHIEVTCERCGAFPLNFLLACRIVEELLDYLPDPDFTLFSNKLDAPLQSLYDCFCDAAGEFFPDPFALDDEEVAVIFDTSCACYEYLVGESETKKIEENHPEETHFYHPAPRVSVKMYIGPRLKW